MAQEIGLDVSDSDLLARYCASRSAVDFTAIVARHGPMVVRTCMRLTNNVQDAEDAAQATFLALAQKPTAAQTHLAGWLHKVARDCACQVLRERARRARREEAHARMRTTPKETDADLREELDAALVRLPAELREAVVLRYLEGRDSEEGARVAGCNSNTFRWRAMKGLERLRNILVQREVVCSVSGLTAFLALEASASAATTGIATSLAGIAAGGIEGGRAALIAKNVVGGLFWTKAKLCGATVAAAVAVAGVAVPLALPSAKPAVQTAPAAVQPVKLGLFGSLGGRRLFPDDNPWSQDISAAPVDPASDRYIAGIGRDRPLFPDFGTVPDQVRVGIPYVVVSGAQPRVPIRFEEFADESDPGPYPVPLDAPVEGGEEAKESRRLLVLDRDNWKLYELTGARREGAGWRAAGGAVFDLNSNTLRPAGWTAADPAGLPILAGLVRYDEVVEQKAIRHALRFSCRRIRHAFVAPARHAAGHINDPNLPPMGMRVRLKANVDLARFPPPVQVVLQALKTHGMFLANQGSDWYLSGTSDPRWSGIDMKPLTRITGKDFEVIQMGKIQTTGK